MAAAEPPTKKAKTEDKAVEEPAKVEEAVAKKAKPEPPKEQETDAAADKSPKITGKVSFLQQETTLNVAQSMFGNMLTCLSDGGFQYLLAGARANVGVKSGRYMFEVNVVELMQQKQETANVTGRPPQPRNFFRVGLSTAGSSLMIGEDADSICFDAEGSFIHNKKKVATGGKFERSMNVSILLNLDANSPNANTVSIFKDGVRICQPQALPEHLKGKALFPTVTYRNVTVHYNFGALAHAALPFTCRMFQDAATKDAEVTKDASISGKCTAVFPCGLPEEGTFQWLDGWLKENPGYTELSDRAILEWAQKSGIARLKPYTSVACKDKPGMGFGLPTMDDKSIQKMILMTASMQKRNFVVPEIQSVLVKEERALMLANFAAFKKVALVVCGEPPASFKKTTHDSVLKDKQDVSDAAFKKTLAEEKRVKAEEKKKKEAAKKKKKDEKAKKKAEEERKKKVAEQVKKRAADLKKAQEEKEKKKVEEAKKKKAEEDKAAGKEPEEEEVKEEEKMDVDEVKEEEKVEEETKEEESEEEEEPMEVEEEDPAPPKAELTAEEKKLWFKPSITRDVTDAVLNGSFAKYSFPEKADGFDEVKYEWQNAAKSAEYLAQWRSDKKVTARVEDLVVGEWFDARSKEWAKFLQACKQKQNDYKAQLSKRAADKAAKEKAKQMKEMQAKAKAEQVKKQKEQAEKIATAKAEKKAAEKEAKAAARAAKEAAGEVLEPEEEEPEEEAKPMEVEEEKAEEEEDEAEEEEENVDIETVDVFAVDDIMEIGGKPVQQPLFSQFAFEDWALMSLRFELSLLVHAFKKDVKDAERTGIHYDNIGFYYQKYFRKGLNPAFFGVKSTQELLQFFNDTLTLSNKKILDTFLPGEFETLNVFVLLTEQARRDRSRRVDMGEEGAQIKMTTQLAGMSTGLNPAFAAMAVQRPGVAMAGQGLTVAGRPNVGPGGALRPALQPVAVRPQAWAQPQAWGAPQPQAWGAAPAWAPVSPWAAAPRPVGGLVRPVGGAKGMGKW